MLNQNDKNTKTTASKKRVREDVSEEERDGTVTRRGAKRRVVQKAAYVEIASRTTTRVCILTVFVDHILRFVLD